MTRGSAKSTSSSPWIILARTRSATAAVAQAAGLRGPEYST